MASEIVMNRSTRFDFGKLRLKDEPISYEESLKDYVPFGWEDDAWNGKCRVDIVAKNGHAALLPRHVNNPK